MSGPAGVDAANGTTGRQEMLQALSGLVGKLAVILVPCALLAMLFLLSRAKPEEGGNGNAAVRREVDRVWQSSFSAPDLARLRQSVGHETKEGTVLAEQDGRFSIVVRSPSTEDCTLLLKTLPLHVEGISVSRGGGGIGAALSDPGRQCGDGSVLSVAVARPFQTPDATH